eukprot:16438491-Heterocapsa_arctica.AAC.1
MSMHVYTFLYVSIHREAFSFTIILYSCVHRLTEAMRTDIEFQRTKLRRYQGAAIVVGIACARALAVRSLR